MRIIPLLLMSALAAQGAQILWSSARNVSNLQSNGTALSGLGTVTFQLGSFSSGFTPTPENTKDWLKNWLPAQSTNYNNETGFFASSFSYVKNTDALSPTSRAYIWGFDRQSDSKAGSGEWVLLGNPDWRWPSASTGVISFAEQWLTTKSGTVAIVGKLSNDPLAKFHLQTQAVALSASTVSPESWLNQYLAGAGDSQRAWSADPDGDGLDNLLEFATGRNPAVGEAGDFQKVQVVGQGAQRTLQVTLARQSAPPQVKLRAEVSTDMLSWKSGASEAVLEESATAIVARDLLPLGKGRRFLRITASF